MPVTGIAGQVGFYLTELLLEKPAAVWMSAAPVGVDLALVLRLAMWWSASIRTISASPRSRRSSATPCVLRANLAGYWTSAYTKWLRGLKGGRRHVLLKERGFEIQHNGD